METVQFFFLQLHSCNTFKECRGVSSKFVPSWRIWRRLSWQTWHNWWMLLRKQIISLLKRKLCQCSKIVRSCFQMWTDTWESGFLITSFFVVLFFFLIFVTFKPFAFVAVTSPAENLKNLNMHLVEQIYVEITCGWRNNLGLQGCIDKPWGTLYISSMYL